MLYIARDADCHGLRPRNDSGRQQLVLLFWHSGQPTQSAWAVPHALQENMYCIAKKCLHFPFIRARISIVNAKASIGSSCVRIAYVRESGSGGSRSAQSTGLSPGSCRLKSMETRVRRCDRRYRVEGVSAPDGVRRKANAGGTAEDFFRSFVPKSRGRKAVFRSPQSTRHCEPVRTLVWQSPKVSESFTRLPRRFAPRNDAIFYFSKERTNP